MDKHGHLFQLDHLSYFHQTFRISPLLPRSHLPGHVHAHPSIVLHDLLPSLMRPMEMISTHKGKQPLRIIHLAKAYNNDNTMYLYNRLLPLQIQTK